MRYSGIGGQAVMEGVMMKNGDAYAVAVRKSDGEIEVKKDTYESYLTKYPVCRLPFIRGIFAFIDSLVLGMKTLMWSSSFFEEEGEPDRFELFLKKKFGDKADNVIIGITMVLAVVLAIGVFMLLPVFIANIFSGLIASATVLNLIEGLIRIVIFLIYVAAIALMEDIRRTYMYHGAEHKCINCLEHGLDLTVDNVRASSRFHKRCGTSFLLIIMVISVLVYSVFHVDNMALRLFSRIILIPVIAGVSYEFLRLAGRSDNKVVDILSKPGLWLQKLTTQEPDDSMIEVGIASVEAVFDWRAFLEETRAENSDAKENKL